MSKQWTDEQVFLQFMKEIRDRFEAENVSHVAEEIADIAEVIRQNPEYRDNRPDWLKIVESHKWHIYQDCIFGFHYNSVQITLSNNGYAVYHDFIEMFEHTSVAWGLPCIAAKLIDNEPHIVIDILLIDYWDDERAAKWVADKN